MSHDRLQFTAYNFAPYTIAIAANSVGDVK
jgi:hypothetical protein